MKAIARGPWPDDKKPYNTWYQPFNTQKEIDDALWFTLSQEVTTAASSSDIRLATMTIDAAERFEPMSKEQQRELVSRLALKSHFSQTVAHPLTKQDQILSNPDLGFARIELQSVQLFHSLSRTPRRESKKTCIVTPVSTSNL